MTSFYITAWRFYMISVQHVCSAVNLNISFFNYISFHLSHYFHFPMSLRRRAGLPALRRSVTSLFTSSLLLFSESLHRDESPTHCGRCLSAADRNRLSMYSRYGTRIPESSFILCSCDSDHGCPPYAILSYNIFPISYFNVQPILFFHTVGTEDLPLSLPEPLENCLPLQRT